MAAVDFKDQELEGEFDGPEEIIESDGQVRFEKLTPQAMNVRSRLYISILQTPSGENACKDQSKSLGGLDQNFFPAQFASVTAPRKLYPNEELVLCAVIMMTGGPRRGAQDPSAGESHHRPKNQLARYCHSHCRPAQTTDSHEHQEQTR